MVYFHNKILLLEINNILIPYQGSNWFYSNHITKLYIDKIYYFGCYTFIIKANKRSLRFKTISENHYCEIKTPHWHKKMKILLKMNMILACTAVYGVFAPYTAGGHGILDIQRNSSCDPCPSPTLVSPLISTSNPRLTRIRWKTSCRNSKSD